VWDREGVGARMRALIPRGASVLLTMASWRREAIGVPRLLRSAVLI
jgi:hypothetical protein